MSGHTEGPWAYRKRAAPRKIMLKRQHWEVGQPHGFGVAIVFGDEDTACLIAAAPEMLGALKCAEEWLKGWASAEPYLDVIRAAISKATQPPPGAE